MADRMSEDELAPTAPEQPAPRRRICRTPEESFAAGWEDGAHDRPLSREEILRIAALIGPDLRRIRAARLATA
jgi:hypothetical protein